LVPVLITKKTDY